MIAHAEDLPKSIKNYQDVLHYARSKVDFVLGEALYMTPSDMNLKIGQIENYNNEIVVANGQMSLGTNQEINVQHQDVHKEIPAEGPKSNRNGASLHEQNKNVLVVSAVGLGLVYHFLV